MASSTLKFYKDGFLKLFKLEDILRRNVDYDAIDSEGEVFVPRVPVSDETLVLPGKVWIKELGGNVSEVYYGNKLMYRFDRSVGNLLFGFNDISVLPLEKGGTNYEAEGADDAAKLADLLENHFMLKTAAFKDAGVLADQTLLLSVDNQLPAIDGSLLTGISNTPVGTVTWHASPNAPTGKLKCNGAQVSRTVYADLFAEIGTIWGNGNGTTTFTLPDLRGVFVRGWDDSRGLDPARAFATYQADELKSHTHPLQASGGTTGGLYQAVSIDAYYGVRYDLVYAAGGTETRPKNVTLLPCIHY